VTEEAQRSSERISQDERKFRIRTEVVPGVIERLSNDPERVGGIKRLMQEFNKTPWGMARYFADEIHSPEGTASALSLVEDIDSQKAGALLREACFKKLEGIDRYRAKLEAEGEVRSIKGIIALVAAEKIVRGKEGEQMRNAVIEKERQELEGKRKEVTGILEEIIFT